MDKQALIYTILDRQAGAAPVSETPAAENEEPKKKRGRKPRAEFNYITEEKTAEATEQFQSHINTFYTAVGSQEIAFCHYAWLSEQFVYFCCLMMFFDIVWPVD